jgi:8-oxo-dGTP diphosphatase
MICDGAGNILVQDRKDPDWPGICFPGGHVEPGESFVASVIREVREETGLTLRDPVLCGTKQFQTNKGERYVVLFYKAGTFSGQLQSSDEGEVFWLSRQELENVTLCPDFWDMLRVFEEDTLSEFYYYKQEDHWAYTLL